MEEDMHGPTAGEHEVIVAIQAMFTALLASVERDSPGTIGSVAKTAEGIITTTLQDSPVTLEMAAAHVSRLAGQASRLVLRAQQGRP